MAIKRRRKKRVRVPPTKRHGEPFNKTEEGRRRRAERRAAAARKIIDDHVRDLDEHWESLGPNA